MKRSCALALILALASTAHAESRSKLFPLSSSGLPRSMKGAPGELTRVLSRSLGAEATTVPIEDAAALLECSLVERSCLEAIAKSVGVKTILFGRIDRDDGVVVVKLTTFETTQKRESQRTFELSGDTAEAMGDSLRDKLEVKPVEPPAPTRTLDVLPPTPAATGGGVTPATWGMVIGGGATLGVGLGFLVSANSLRAKVATAPTETRTDISRLVAMENAGRARMQLGAGLTALGGVITTIGVVRMIVQKRRARPEEPRLEVVPEAGGASVVFSMGWK